MRDLIDRLLRDYDGVPWTLNYRPAGKRGLASPELYAATIGREVLSLVHGYGDTPQEALGDALARWEAGQQ